MNKLIVKNIFADFFSQKSRLLIGAITYYVILSFVPALIVANKFFLLINCDFSNTLISKTGNLETPLSLLIILFVTIYLTSKIFNLFSNKNNRFLATIKSFLWTALFIVELVIFIALFSIENLLLQLLFQSIILLLFLSEILAIRFKKISFIGIVSSAIFSIVISCFIYTFEIISPHIFDYENYYSYLAPLFLIILEIYIIINLIYLNLVFVKNFQCFSSIKVIKM
ncbi:MAG: hypothetical protein IKJ30_03325 [Bacilli bacterium]|nr:hypothetical protein [Bacilli bacterium]